MFGKRRHWKLICSVCYERQFGKCCRRTNFFCLTPDPRRTRNSTVKKSSCQRSPRPKVTKHQKVFFLVLRIRIQLFILMRIRLVTFHFDADPVCIRIQHKMEYKGHKIKNVRPIFWETMLLLTLKRQDYVQFLLSLKNCVKYCLVQEQKPDPEQ
jgi:hypothetical protein